MFKVRTNIDSIDKIDKHLKLVKKISLMKDDKEFQDYIRSKCWETLQRTIEQRLIGGTTNDEEIDLYKSSNHIEETKDGFIIYNDAKIPADKYNILPFDTSGYPDGKFSIALAFEYGVGVVGAINGYGSNKGYVYNDIANSKSHGHTKGYNTDEWYLPKRVYGESGRISQGYDGFEIYRFTAIEIETQLPKWVDDYYGRYVNG